MREIKEIRIDWSTIWKLLVFLGIVFFIYNAHNALVSFLAGIVLALGIEPVIDFINERLRVKRWLATFFVFVTLLLFILVFLYLVVPVFFNEVTEFIRHLNDILPKIPWFTLYGQNIPSDLSSLYKLVSQETNVSSTFFGLLKNLVLALSAVVIMLYFSVEKNGPQKMLKAVLPEAYEKPILEVFNRFAAKMRRWLGTQFLLSFSIGLVVFVGLSILGVKYSLFLGITAGILELVPIIGPIVTAVLAFIIAISESFTLGLYAVIFFTVVQQLENHFLIPLLVGKTMRVHPVIVIVAILGGGELAGFVGILLATPLAILIQEIINYLSEIKQRRENSLPNL